MITFVQQFVTNHDNAFEINEDKDESLRQFISVVDWFWLRDDLHHIKVISTFYVMREKGVRVCIFNDGKERKDSFVPIYKVNYKLLIRDGKMLPNPPCRVPVPSWIKRNLEDRIDGAF